MPRQAALSVNSYSYRTAAVHAKHNNLRAKQVPTDKRCCSKYTNITILDRSATASLSSRLAYTHCGAAAVHILHILSQCMSTVLAATFDSNMQQCVCRVQCCTDSRDGTDVNVVQLFWPPEKR